MEERHGWAKTCKAIPRRYAKFVPPPHSRVTFRPLSQAALSSSSLPNPSVSLRAAESAASGKSEDHSISRAASPTDTGSSALYPSAASSRRRQGSQPRAQSIGASWIPVKPESKVPRPSAQPCATCGATCVCVAFESATRKHTSFVESFCCDIPENLSSVALSRPRRSGRRRSLVVQQIGASCV